MAVRIEEHPSSPIGLPPPGNKTPIQFATFLLCAGAEIEHSVLVQYLYAAYSINEQQDSPERAALALRWKTTIRQVAREEMAHLITVQNLLLAVGHDFQLNRGHLHGGASDQTLPFVLEPLSAVSLAKYVILESPSDDQMSERTAAAMKGVHSVIDSESHERLSRIGLLYAAIYWVFLESNNPGSDWPFPAAWVDDFKKTYPGEFHLKATDFAPTTNYQSKSASAREWGIYEENSHADEGNPRDVALASLRWIMSQGEGPNAIEKSHFLRFLSMFEEFVRLGPGARSMVFNVPTNPVADAGPQDPGSTRIVNEESRRLAQLFNVRYRLLLLDTLQSLSSSRTQEAATRQRYAEWSVREMEFLKRIGQILPHRPLGSLVDGKEGWAAAPFQTVGLPPDSAERVRLMKELVEESGGLIGKIRDSKAAKSDDPWLAMEPSLLDEIGAHDDAMIGTILAAS